jgi:hypothetical protein
VVIQAKHTEIPTKLFSESDFSGETKSSVIGKELLRVQELIAKGELDFYMLFANRRLNAVAEEKIRKRIAAESGLELFCASCAQVSGSRCAATAGRIRQL